MGRRAIVTALERNRLPWVGRLGRVWGVRDSKWHRIDFQETARDGIMHKPRFHVPGNCSIVSQDFIYKT